MIDRTDEWLTERLGAVPYKPDSRDYVVQLVTPEILNQLPTETTELLDYVSNLTERSQGDIGSCVGHCNAFATEVSHNIYETSAHEFDLSAGWTYQKSREYAGIPLPGEGSTNFGAMKALHKEGVCLESLCPTDTVKPFDFEPKQGAEEDASKRRIHSYYRVPTNPTAMKSALMGLTHDAGYRMPDGRRGLCPLVSAYKVYDTYKEGYDDGYVPLPKAGDKLLGGHSSLLVGWIVVEGKEYWVNYNSWGEDIGGSLTNSQGESIGGLFFLPIEYPFMDCWVFSVDKPTEPPTPEPKLGCRVVEWLSTLFNCGKG
jgi:hypothetical protein